MSKETEMPFVDGHFNQKERQQSADYAVLQSERAKWADKLEAIRMQCHGTQIDALLLPVIASLRKEAGTK
jgi:hypothetical protein